MQKIILIFQQEATIISRSMFDKVIDNYNVKHSDVEILSKYFDVVPDGNIFTKELMPVFAVRLKTDGISVISSYYRKKYNIKIDVVGYVINCSRFTMYSNDASLIFSDDSNFVSKFNFDSLSDNEMRGLITVIVNNDHRLMHAIPIVYGKQKSKKVAILLDPYYVYDNRIDHQCSTMLYLDFLKKHFTGITIYCHDIKLQADHHSCGIIACDIIKNCLVGKGKIAKKMIKNATLQESENISSKISFYHMKLDHEILKLSQLKRNFDNVGDIDTSKYKIAFSEYISSNIINVKYYKEPSPYNPNQELIPNDRESIIDKDVNAKLLKKGHTYAKIICDIKKQDLSIDNYSPNYWLKFIDNLQKPRKLIKFFRDIKDVVTKRLHNKSGSN